MDIIRFVNSPEVQAHLKEIGYQPDLYTATWLVHHSRQVLLREKMQAFCELLDAYPDAEAAGVSLHALIRAHIAETEAALSAFFRGSEDSLYTVQQYNDQDRAFCGEGGIYTSFEKLRHILSDNEDVTLFRVARYYKDQDESVDTVELWPNGEVRGILSLVSELDSLLFENEPPAVPSPHKPGDLVTVYSGEYAIHSNHRYEVGVLAEKPLQYRALAYIVDGAGLVEHLGFGCDMVTLSEGELDKEARATLTKIRREHFDV